MVAGSGSAEVLEASSVFTVEGSVGEPSARCPLLGKEKSSFGVDCKN